MTTTLAAETSRESLLTTLRERTASVDLRDDKEFHRILLEAKRLLEISDSDISEVFLVTRPTVNRWVNGKNLPHPAMRKPIFTWVNEELSHKLNNLKRGGSYRGSGGEAGYMGEMVARSR